MKIFKIIYHKKKIFLLALIFLPISIFLILISRIIFIKKSFKFLPVSFSRIANIYPLFWFLKIKEVKKQDNTKYLFFVQDNTKYNKTWFKLWDRKVQFLIFSEIWKQFFTLSRFFPGHNKIALTKFDEFLHNLYLSKVNQKKLEIFNQDELRQISETRKIFLNFNEDEQSFGKKYLEEMKIKEFNYICFHSRDSAYLKFYNNKIDWSYHNFRDSNIDNYLPAMESLTNKGFSCLRMGSKVEKGIKTNNSKIIDYAMSKSQSDFLDIFLASKCFMAVYSESGISVIPEIFNRPIVYVNWPAINFSCFNHDSLVIPKKFFSKEKKRLLTFSEIIELNLEKSFKTETLKNLGIDLIENTPEEISSAVNENIKRIKKEWIDDKESIDLQKKFWSLFNYNYIKSSSFRIGSSFLKENQNLLK